MFIFESLHDYQVAKEKQDLARNCFMIQGYCQEWPLHREDLFDYLNHEYGDDGIFIEKDINTHSITATTVRNYIEIELLTQGTRVMGNWSWKPHLTHADRLSNSFFIPEELELEAVSQSLMGKLAICPWLLMSAQGTTTSMHQDMLSVNGIVGQLAGSKLFTLVAPEYLLSQGRYYSTETLQELNIPCTQIILNAGDFLYFPKRWWHQAKALELSATLIHSTVNQYNSGDFLEETVAQMFHFIQRLQLSAKKRSLFASQINRLSNGFRLLEQQK